jgi:hypothetical protein
MPSKNFENFAEIERIDDEQNFCSSYPVPLLLRELLRPFLLIRCGHERRRADGPGVGQS